MTSQRPSHATSFRLLLSILVLPAAACSGLHAGAAAPEPSLPAERFALSGAAVTVQDVAGEVRVEPGTGTDVVVTVTRVGADANRLRIERGANGKGDAIRIIADSRRLLFPALPGGADSVEFRQGSSALKPGNGGFLGLFTGRSTKVLRTPGAAGATAHADVVVQLPPGRRLEVQLGAGRLAVGATSGEVHAYTIGGATEAGAPAGRVVLDAHAGGITARGGSGELTLTSRGGPVDVSGFHGSSLTVRTQAGGITGDDVSAASISFRSGAGDVGLSRARATRVEAIAGAGELRLREVAADTVVARTGVGNVALQDVSAAHATVHTKKGRVTGQVETRVTARQ